MARQEEATVNGVLHATVIDLARMTGKTTRTIERWVVAGVIPQPATRTEHGWKLWHPNQVREILDTAQRRRKPPPKEGA